jgi:hypothetical protein
VVQIIQIARINRLPGEMPGRRRARPALRLPFGACAEGFFGGAKCCDSYGGQVAIARKSLCGIYRVVTLFAGHVVFDEIRVLQAHKLDSEAVFDMADDAPLGLADRHDDADRRPEIRRDPDGRAGL